MSLLFNEMTLILAWNCWSFVSILLRKVKDANFHFESITLAAILFSVIVDEAIDPQLRRRIGQICNSVPKYECDMLLIEIQ
jgi:hypothetical protein